jgi:hypothetical protein
MAESPVICPHCQHRVETPVPVQARTRLCSHCGGTLPEGAGQVPALPNGYANLPSDTFERMRLDPSLARLRWQFLGAVALVALLVVAVTVAHYRGEAKRAQGMTAPAAQERAAMPAAPAEARKIQHVRPAFTPVSIEERLGRLSGAEPADPLGKGEKLAAPVFDFTATAAEAPPTGEGAAPSVFQVQDRPVVVSPER